MAGSSASSRGRGAGASSSIAALVEPASATRSRGTAPIAPSTPAALPWVSLTSPYGSEWRTSVAPDRHPQPPVVEIRRADEDRRIEVVRRLARAHARPARRGVNSAATPE